MPPKKDVPKGLKEFLQKPENVERRKQAIAKNKEARAVKALEIKVKKQEKLLQEEKDKRKKAYIDAVRKRKTNPEPKYKSKKLLTGITRENRNFPFYSTIN